MQGQWDHATRQACRDSPAGGSEVFILARTIVYATLFVGLVLVYLPAQVLSWSGIVNPQVIGVPQIGGMVIATAGGAVALWCVATFVWVGKGTPAPFDPPRRLVVTGPYRFVRNPMYIGAALALGGAALYYQSPPLLGYAALFLLVAHVFVAAYEERVLRETFGGAYEAYCARVHRWWPSRAPLTGHNAGADDG
jgi:protein-S-isoprenylcysteine O-methyltransferase Ste14